MVFKIIYTTLALIDTDETAGWYDKEMPGLGLRFLVDLNRTIEILQNNPFVFSFLSGEVRKAKLKKFPYLIFFLIEDNSVRILAVTSTKRSKRFIRKRIKRGNKGS